MAAESNLLMGFVFALVLAYLGVLFVVGMSVLGLLYWDLRRTRLAERSQNGPAVLPDTAWQERFG
jgi:cbb3-type cytochrome oxidase subunit 3